jgi:hypothetical protein
MWEPRLGVRSLLPVACVVAGAALLGWVLSLATTRVKNWFVMPDEMYYERLAVSVAQTGSLLPRLHDELVGNVNQLYPVLLSFVFGDGNVPASLADAHRLNAFLMTSVAIPAFLLARRAGVGPVVSVVVGLLSASVPWVVLSSFLLTEVVAYPAFSWALLALVHAVERRTVAADVLALGAIAFAVLARAQFLILLAVLLVAVVADAFVEGGGRRAAVERLRRRPVILVVYGLGAAALLVATATGSTSRLLGAYSVTAEGIRVDLDLFRLAAEHVAVLALGLALLPFLLGVAWLVERLRASAAPAERALALVGCSTLALVVLQVASFDQRFGAGEVKDRYLFYVAPLVLVGVAGALTSPRAPRWWAIAGLGAVCVAGFLALPLRTYEKLNVDSPVTMLNDSILRLATSETSGRWMLALATLVSVQLLVLAPSVVPVRAVAAGAALVACVALPLETAYAFERLFRVDGTNGLPVTLDQGGVFNWVDRAVGGGGRVTMFPYPSYGVDIWADQGYWWDVEFWNESVVDALDFGGRAGEDPWAREFDPRTGAALRPQSTPHALVSNYDVRFRLESLRQVVFDRNAYLFELELPWRASWLTRGIHGDGWSRPLTPVEILVFPKPGQQQPLRRALTISVGAPRDADSRPVTVTSNLGRWTGKAGPEAHFDQLVFVCVPPDRPQAVTVTTPGLSRIHSDPTRPGFTTEPVRSVGVVMRTIALAGETTPLDRCPRVAPQP